MTDDELVAALRDVFAGPAGEIDRSDGYGEDYVVGGLEVVAGPDGFDDLLVSVTRGDRTTVSRLLFDRAWREASGLDDASAYAAYVLARWQAAVVDDSSVVDDALPAAALRDDLEQTLRREYGNVNHLGLGVVEVVDDDGEIFFVHARPHEWHGFVARRSDPVGDLDELVGSRWDDEQHLVFFRGEFHRSVRAELPPVRSMLLRDAP